jgi:hypothetical protein
MTAGDRNYSLRAAMTAVRDCAETMEAQAASLLQALLRLPMDEGLRARAMERVDRLKDASGRVMFELALLQAEAGEGKAEAAKVVARLTGMDAVMMDTLATLTDVVAELEKAAERDEAKEPAYVRVIEAMGVLLQGLKTAKAATETLAATVPRALKGIPPQLPVRAAADGSVVVLQAGAEGGDVTLIGQTTVAGAWSFARVTDDQTEALFGDSGVEITPPPALKPEDWVDGWDEGLRLMDRYQWARLHPLYVHPAFMERVRAAVEERLADVDSESAERAREKWERLLQQP